MGAGDDQHRDGADQACSGVPSSDQAIRVITAAPRANQNSQPAALSASRWARRRGLCLGDQTLDARQRGVVADGGDPHPQRVVGGHRARDDVVADLAPHRPGLAGDHRLVDVGPTVDHLAVGRHPAARADDDDVPEREVRRADGDDRRRRRPAPPRPAAVRPRSPARRRSGRGSASRSSDPAA